jgi:hypothetical protein
LATLHPIIIMSLDYHYEFRAPALMPVETIRTFLSKVGSHALAMGFIDAVFVDCAFQSDEQRHFARRICDLPWVRDERLQSADFSSDPAVRRLDSGAGECGVFPVSGVILVVVNETGLETTLGFLRFPQSLTGTAGDGERVSIQDPVGTDWQFRHRVQSPDPRYRALVRDFAEAGFLVMEKDEFRPGHGYSGDLVDL